MLCAIYRSSKKDDMYLYVPKAEEGKDDLAELPDSLLGLMGQPQYVMDLELTPERKLARADVGEVLAKLEAEGFYVQMPPTPEELAALEEKLTRLSDSRG